LAKKDKYLVGLDIGSMKTCALIAEVDDEQVRFLALGAAESKGLRKGLIVNLDSTVSSIRRAVEEAEGVANVPVESAVIGVAGSHVRGVNSRGGVSIGHRPRDIEREDVRRAIDAARNITLPPAFAIRSAWSVSASKPTSIWLLPRLPRRKISSLPQIAPAS
jgi:cell division protein FtsA